MFIYWLACETQQCWTSGIGNNDFVATTVALNLATEYWFKLSSHLEKRSEETTTRLEKIEAECNVLRVSNDAKEHVGKEIDKIFSKLKKQTDHTCVFTIKNYKYIAIFFSSVGLITLFLGIERWWNIFLLAPAPVALGYNKWKSKKLKKKAKGAIFQAKEAAGEHAKGNKLIDETFEIKV